MDAGDTNLASTILDLEAKRIAAMVSKDLTTLDALLADDLVLHAFWWCDRHENQLSRVDPRSTGEIQLPGRRRLDH